MLIYAINVRDICKVCCVPMHSYFKSMLQIMVKQNISVKRTQMQMYFDVKMYNCIILQAIMRSICILRLYV